MRRLGIPRFGLVHWLDRYGFFVDLFALNDAWGIFKEGAD